MGTNALSEQTDETLGNYRSCSHLLRLVHCRLKLLCVLPTGIIPRAVRTLFQYINLQPREHKYDVRVSYLEIYNEELVDLLAAYEGSKSNITIREDTHGNIYWTGVREVLVRSPEELLS